MQLAISILIVILGMLAPVLAPPAAAAPSRLDDLSSRDEVLRWIDGYRLRPDPAGVPAAIRVLSKRGALRDPESSGVYVGFIAGIIGSNPERAEDIVRKSLPLPAEDQWAMVRAIAYSGLPDWKQLMRKVADRLPARAVMIERYLSDKLPVLDRIALSRPKPTLMDKVFDVFSRTPKPQHEMTFDLNPELLDTVWGYYFATGSYLPIARVIALLPWSKEVDSGEKLTIGSMAKFTLASNAARNPDLLAMLKRAAKYQRKEVARTLDDVIEAAETVDMARLRRDALASLEDLKRKGPGFKRDISFWGQVGQGTLALGCIVAAATGHVELGVPCVVGGAISSVGLKFWEQQQP